MAVPGGVKEAVWPTVLRVLRDRGLDFEDVHLAEACDREAILREIFPASPLCRAHASTIWVSLSRCMPDGDGATPGHSVPPAPAPVQCDAFPAAPSLPAATYPLMPQVPSQPCWGAPAPPAQWGAQPQAPLNVGAWATFLNALSAKGLVFEDVQHAAPQDRAQMLYEVFPASPQFRHEANAMWEALVPLVGSSRSPSPAQPAAAPPVQQQQRWPAPPLPLPQQQVQQQWAAPQPQGGALPYHPSQRGSPLQSSLQAQLTAACAAAGAPWAQQQLLQQAAAPPAAVHPQQQRAQRPANRLSPEQLAAL
eukprot:TRINITY_DN4432_c0_g2_i2.p2 TRINITY_DN4432_c0_g2~~TRINITY_DN4432_c0_g2_i2.p2  ORF type:complete len:336 (+),score=117.05 TRINITY_DN4432_c0_g2_i2:89-1009(+)